MDPPSEQPEIIPPGHRIALPTDSPPPPKNQTSPRSSSGWDGKLRVEKRAEVVNGDGSEYSDEDAPPVEQIAADEDLLDDYPLDTDEIDLVHRRISSISSLRLERFKQVERLCLRQNAISHIKFPEDFGSALLELDLYDNTISHIKGLELFQNLTSLDLSFNNIKHIKNVNRFRKLRDIYFVQNKISKIEGLEGLDVLRNLELGANRIREIENLDSLSSLEELWLGKNKITEIKNISHLTSLKILDLKSNRLTSISTLSSLPTLEELYISHNALTSLPPASHTQNPNLRVLDISNNQIRHLEYLSHLTSLEEFWASSNQLDSFEEVERELGPIEALETVYLEANPLQVRGSAVYRNKVRLALPGIRQIDATFVR